MAHCSDTDTPSVTESARPLHVTHVIHDLRPGGAEHVLVDMTPLATEAGIELSIVSLLPLDRYDFARRLVEARIQLISLDLVGWWDPRGPRRLREVVDTTRPDVLHSHLKHADVVAGRVAKAAGIPHVSTLHLVEDEVGWVAARKRDLAMRSRTETAAVTIAVSDAVRSWYLEASEADPDSVVTLRNGVPDPGIIGPDEVAAIRADLDVPAAAPLVVMIAVMRPGKGHDALLDAIPLLENDDVVFALAGDGSCETRLRARAAELDRVRFLGFRSDIDRVLAAADLVVHPSQADALPTALVHALAAGKPIVATAVGGIPEIVTYDGGVLVEPGDPEALAGAIDAMLSDPDRMAWMGKQNRERFDAAFRAEQWVEALRAVYEGVLRDI
jgi:glycosyltransferase involved in cell wall biosynthesis